MKPRQITDGLKVESVYGPDAPKKAVFNSAGANLKKMKSKAEKLHKNHSTEGESTGKRIGFAAPSFISQEMAQAIGITTPSALWPAGGKPVFTSPLSNPP